MSYNCNISYTCLFKLFYFYWIRICYLTATWSWFVCWLLIRGRARKLQIAFLWLLCQMAFIWKENTIEKEQTIYRNKKWWIISKHYAKWNMSDSEVAYCKISFMTFWKMQNNGNWEQICDCWGLGSGVELNFKGAAPRVF